jgi:NitT/TauT family transport system permease protein
VSAGFIGVILAELLITPTGIGDLITYHQSTASYPEMYAAITAIIMFSALALIALQWVELRIFRPEKRGV